MPQVIARCRTLDKRRLNYVKSDAVLEEEVKVDDNGGGGGGGGYSANSLNIKQVKSRGGLVSSGCEKSPDKSPNEADNRLQWQEN